ncbi:MAG: hypothetical protein J3K34DRAFT_405936 [Monoraphidium minutum]|nr:MAG: hypothetical protein J3K34DRAFT_405936 [Monoraphidium minutum]
MRARPPAARAVHVPLVRTWVPAHEFDQSRFVGPRERLPPASPPQSLHPEPLHAAAPYGARLCCRSGRRPSSAPNRPPPRAPLNGAARRSARAWPGRAHPSKSHTQGRGRSSCPPSPFLPPPPMLLMPQSSQHPGGPLLTVAAHIPSTRHMTHMAFPHAPDHAVSVPIPGPTPHAAPRCGAGSAPSQPLITNDVRAGAPWRTPRRQQPAPALSSFARPFQRPAR